MNTYPIGYSYQQNGKLAKWACVRKGKSAESVLKKFRKLPGIVAAWIVK